MKGKFVVMYIVNQTQYFNEEYHTVEIASFRTRDEAECFIEDKYGCYIEEEWKVIR